MHDSTVVALKNILLGAQTPLAVGVYGPWGSGKTSLMRMLKHEFDAERLKGQRATTHLTHTNISRLTRADLPHLPDAPVIPSA